MPENFVRWASLRMREWHRRGVRDRARDFLIFLLLERAVVRFSSVIFCRALNGSRALNALSASAAASSTNLVRTCPGCAVERCGYRLSGRVLHLSTCFPGLPLGSPRFAESQEKAVLNCVILTYFGRTCNYVDRSLCVTRFQRCYRVPKLVACYVDVKLPLSGRTGAAAFRERMAAGVVVVRGSAC